VSLPALRRVRWAVRGTLTLGVAASVAANILHARPNPISQAIAAWPPLALLLTVELISRVPMHRRLLAAARLGATAGIAAIAAWVSYWHMAGVAARYGESASSAYLLPLSVDGLIIVGSVSLVELAGRIRSAEGAATTVAEPAPAPAPPVVEPAVEPSIEPAPKPVTPGPRRPAAKAPAQSTARAAPRQRRPAAETAALAEAIQATHPDISRSELARQLGISVSRLTTVQREMQRAA
jgi:hypothetical protein